MRTMPRLTDKFLAGPIGTLRRILALLWQASRGWTLLAGLLMLLEIAFGLAALYLIKQLVDVITAALGQDAGEPDLSRVLLFVVLTAASTIAFLVSRSLAGLAREAQGMRVADHVDGLVQAGALRVDLAFYESPHYFDTLRRARQSGNQRPAQVVGNLLNLIRNVIMLVAVVVLILSISPLLVPLVVAATLPALLVRLHFTRRLYQWARARTQSERRAGYFDWLMTSDTHAKEVRLNRLGQVLRSWYRDLRGTLRRERYAIHRKRALFEAATAIVATLLFFTALGYLAAETARGQTSVGDLVLFLLIFQRAQSAGQELVQQISRFYEDHLYIGLLFEFIDIEPRISSPADPKPVPESIADGIRLEDVCFTYPGTRREVLTDIDLALPPGRVTALVGANGSGKTSLIKLLCRLYDPTSGRITLDGIDARHFDLVEYRRLFSVIFQDYARYALTARDNIRFGDIDLDPDSTRIERAAEQAGARDFIEQLNHGLDTRLSRMFDGGQELSLGQWQRIALARALVDDSRFIILDEPTSALDPEAEFDLFRHFRERIGNRSALVISHRLSTIRMADEICVLEEGRITERGSHDELVRAGAVYAGMFERQGRFYRTGKDKGIRG